LPKTKETRGKNFGVFGEIAPKKKTKKKKKKKKKKKNSKKKKRFSIKFKNL